MPGPAAQRAFGKLDVAILIDRRDRHRARRRLDLSLRQEPARQHGFGERDCDRETSGGAQYAKTFGEARTRAAAIFRHPGQRQAGFGQRLPERGLPLAFFVAIDGLGIGQIGENLFRGLGNNVLTLRHSVPHY